MKYLEFIQAGSIQQASEEMQKGAMLSAGGTDLIGELKDQVLPDHPEKVVSIKGLQELAYIREGVDGLHIGSNVTLRQISDSPVVGAKAPALAEAAYSVATPNIRNTATIGGNICQDIRCWYYRYPNNLGGALNCMRKGGETCYAVRGENRYHSIFGGEHVHSTPCSSACPAGTDIPSYMAFLREDDWDKAAKTILKYNPMPMITSRICPHLCQDKCNQKVYGDAVNIHGVERSLGDHIMEHADEYYQFPSKETGKTIAVIGAGPGGLTAAFYLRKAGNRVIVYDKMKKAGGVLRYGIPHYRLPKTLVDRYVELLEGMGIEFRMDTMVGQDITVDEIKGSADAVYFGTGAWKQPILGLEGERLTEFGLDFLVEVNTYLQRAIGNDVLVCGGGSVAMDVALTAKRLGAKTVRLVCLEQKEEMPAMIEEVIMAEEEGVEIYNGWGLSKVLTDASGKIEGLEVMRCLSVRDANGRFAPTYDMGEKQILKADCIILATGQSVDLSFLGDKLAEQLRSARGLIDADLGSGRTHREGFYAGGDVVTGPNLAIRAIYAGRISADSINRDLGVRTSAAMVEKPGVTFDILQTKVNVAAKLSQRAVAERTLTEEDHSSYDCRTACSEYSRCMDCACYAVNSSDIANVLVAYDAMIKTNMRTLTADEMFTRKTRTSDVLRCGEIVEEIVIPYSNDGTIAHYDKYRLRRSIDFAVVSVASIYEMEHGKVKKARIVLGACAPVPHRARWAERFLEGKKLTEDVIEEASQLALYGAVPMAKNSYKIEIAKVMVADSLKR